MGQAPPRRPVTRPRFIALLEAPSVAQGLRIEVGETTYLVSGRHELYLVRGDAAVLDEGQEARPDRWYLRRWDDLSTQLAAGSPPDAATWGTVKLAFEP